MPENDHANNDSGEADKKNDSTPHATVRAEPFRLRRIVVGGIVAGFVLLFLSIYLPHMTERGKFFTANFISLVVLFVVAVQSYISRKQWDAMERQSRAMQEQLETMRDTLKLNERAAAAAEIAARAAEQNADTAARALSITERAYVVLGDLKLTEALTPGKNPAVTIHYFNSGRTAATNVIWQAIMYAEEMRRGIRWNPELTRPGEGITIPADKTRPVNYVARLILTEPMLAAITDGRIRLFVEGRFTTKICWATNRFLISVAITNLRPEFSASACRVGVTLCAETSLAHKVSKSSPVNRTLCAKPIWWLPNIHWIPANQSPHACKKSCNS